MRKIFCVAAVAAVASVAAFWAGCAESSNELREAEYHSEQARAADAAGDHARAARERKRAVEARDAAQRGDFYVRPPVEPGPPSPNPTLPPPGAPY